MSLGFVQNIGIIELLILALFPVAAVVAVLAPPRRGFHLSSQRP